MKFSERKCRVCGCTWNRACPDGCCWVEIDLCSACAGKDKGRALMTPDEAARQAREYLDGDHPIPVEVGRALLKGYEAAVKDWKEAAQNSESTKACHACKNCLESDDGEFCKLTCGCKPEWRGPEPSREGATC